MPVTQAWASRCRASCRRVAYADIPASADPALERLGQVQPRVIADDAHRAVPLDLQGWTDCVRGANTVDWLPDAAAVTVLSAHLMVGEALGGSNGIDPSDVTTDDEAKVVLDRLHEMPLARCHPDVVLAAKLAQRGSGGAGPRWCRRSRRR